MSNRKNSSPKETTRVKLTGEELDKAVGGMTAVVSTLEAWSENQAKAVTLETKPGFGAKPHTLEQTGTGLWGLIFGKPKKRNGMNGGGFTGGGSSTAL